MLYSLLADLVVVVHALFVLFVVVGGALVLRHPRIAWIHVPAAVWGVAIEYFGWVCPLTPLEAWLRGRAGMAQYTGGFIEHYLEPVLYPLGLTRHLQLILGTAALLINILAYALVLARRRHRNA